jgi:hypothetical protein
VGAFLNFWKFNLDKVIRARVPRVTRPSWGALRHAVPAAAIDLLVPLSLDLFGFAFEAGDRQRPVSLISCFNREIHWWDGACWRGLGHGWQPATGKSELARVPQSGS